MKIKSLSVLILTAAVCLPGSFWAVRKIYAADDMTPGDFNLTQGGMKMSDNNVDDTDGLWEKTKDGATKVWDKTKEMSSKAWDKTKEFSSEAWNATKETTTKAGNIISEKSQNVWKATKDDSAKAWEKTKDVSKDAWKATKNAATKTDETISEHPADDPIYNPKNTSSANHHRQHHN